jgi:hypothetical protein
MPPWDGSPVWITDKACTWMQATGHAGRAATGESGPQATAKAALHQDYFASSGSWRVFFTSSMRPNFTASSALMKLSRSSASSISFTERPVCFT